MSVGETLVRARQDRGLSVEDISAKTRIRTGLIRAIESDDFGRCGGTVYARGHIRGIARAIGIDPEPLIAEFDDSHAGEADAPIVPEAAVDRHVAARVDRHAPNWTAAMVVTLVVVCVLAAVGLFTKGHSSKQTAKNSNQGPAATATTPTHSPSPPSPPSSAVAQLPPTAAIALIRVTGDRTWLSVETVAGRLLFQGLLSTGQSRAFRDSKGLRLVIGNAPAVDLVADGRDVGAPKSSGNVAHVTIQPGGDVQYA